MKLTFISKKHQSLRIYVGKKFKQGEFIFFKNGKYETNDLDIIKILIKHSSYKHEFDTPNELFVTTSKGEIRDVFNLDDKSREKLKYDLKSIKKVTIIIGTRYNPENLENCLASLYKCTPKGYKLILVNNQANEESVKIIEKYKKVFGKNMTVITNKENKGFSEFNNQAVRKAKTAYILFLNDDTILKNGWLQSMICILETYPNAGAVGKMALLKNRKTLQLGGVLSNGQSPYIFAYCMLLRKKDARFDERYKVAGWEDIDLCEELKAKGYLLYVEREFPIIHLGGESTMKRTPNVLKIYAQNQKLYELKWAKKKTHLFHEQ